MAAHEVGLHVAAGIGHGQQWQVRVVCLPTWVSSTVGATLPVNNHRLVHVLRCSLYVCEATGQVIRKITPGGAVTLVAGTVGTTGAANGAGNVATFYNPIGVCVDSAGK